MKYNYNNMYKYSYDDYEQLVLVSMVYFFPRLN